MILGIFAYLLIHINSLFVRPGGAIAQPYPAPTTVVDFSSRGQFVTGKFGGYSLIESPQSDTYHSQATNS